MTLLLIRSWLDAPPLRRQVWTYNFMWEMVIDKFTSIQRMSLEICHLYSVGEGNFAAKISGSGADSQRTSNRQCYFGPATKSILHLCIWNSFMNLNFSYLCSCTSWIGISSYEAFGPVMITASQFCSLLRAILSPFTSSIIEPSPFVHMFLYSSIVLYNFFRWLKLIFPHLCLRNKEDSFMEPNSYKFRLSLAQRDLFYS